MTLFALSASAQQVSWPDQLPVEAREALEHDGVWVGTKEFRQVFEAYNDPPGPIFVTCDGPIVAGYRLMERTAMRMERWSYALLAQGLREIEAGLADAERSLLLPAETAAAASVRARLVVAVALLLLGEKPQGLDEAALARPRECAALVERAEGRSMAPGLGPPDPGWLGFEWRLFKPRGPFAGAAWGERAFRAMRWLSAVPFRLDRDEELAALWMIRRAGDYYWPSPMWAVGLLPVSEEQSLFADAFRRDDDDAGLGAAQLASLRTDLRNGLGDRKSSDLLYVVPRGGELRLAPRVRLPEDQRFFDLLNPAGRPPHAGAGFPAGLAVARMLGSPLAHDLLADAWEGAGREASVASLVEGNSWIAKAHRMRAALLDAAEPDAPALFSSPAWHRKALRTALGSWALERNIWTLHSGPEMTYGGGPKQLPGLVEPEPAVFAALAEMGRTLLAWMEREEVDGQAMRLEHADAVLAYTRESVRSLLDPDQYQYLPPSERRLLSWLAERGVVTAGEERALSAPMPSPGSDGGVRRRRQILETGASEAAVEEEIRVVRERLAPLLAAAEQWHARATDLSAKSYGPPPGVPLAPEWKRWIDLCTRLELLAHKQLRQQRWSDEDAAFLKDYGVKLGEMMGYSYGSVQHAEDDAPRAAAVVCDPIHDTVRIVATGRPREIWVLYPYRGERWPCRGVVLSYYEHDAREVPTDAEWKALLDSNDPPREPGWLTGR